MQPTLFSSLRLTVSQITFHIRKMLEGDPQLQDVWVEGEISNLSKPASGHIYFTLKDKSAALRCVMWRTDAARNRAALQDGMAVEAHGKIAVYEPQGQYQLVANLIQPKGEGALYQEFLRLKAKLEVEGLFDSARKRPIPEQPRVIGIVTSATGAALRDMLNTLRRRQPLARVLLAPAPVQGVDAPPALVAALNALNQHQPDVILLARGGGSIEDLWAFNDERVVRAVAESAAPLICGVGHETDFTLCDFAADLRAPTPTAAAELASPVSVNDLRNSLADLQARLVFLTSERIAAQRSLLVGLRARLKFSSPQRRIQLEAQRVDELTRRGALAWKHQLALRANQLQGAAKKLAALNPNAILQRGYAILTRNEDGVLVSSVSDARGTLTAQVSDGTFEVTPHLKQ
ncbi:MAG: exodeoxyribonuclease VII large subunit [Anaerolineales bacterium]